MTPIDKDKIEAICEKWNLKELNFTKGVFIAEDNSGITVNLRENTPVVGVTIAGTLHTKGHGNLRVQDLETEIMNVLKSKPVRIDETSQSSRNDKKAEVKDESKKNVSQKTDQNKITSRPYERTKKGGQDTSLSQSPKLPRPEWETELENIEKYNLISKR